jgi:hypothetical protein
MAEDYPLVEARDLFQAKCDRTAFARLYPRRTLA